MTGEVLVAQTVGVPSPPLMIGLNTNGTLHASEEVGIPEGMDMPVKVGIPDGTDNKCVHKEGWYSEEEMNSSKWVF